MKFIASFFICIMLIFGFTKADNTDTKRNDEYTNYEYNSYSDITYVHDSEFEYFDLLNDQGKMYYDAIYNLSWELSDDMTGIYFFEDPDEFDAKACEKAENYVFYDHPELELAQIEFRFGEYSSEHESYMTVYIKSEINHNEYSQLINEVDFEIKDLVDEVNNIKDLTSKYKVINQWMIDNVKYDYEYAKYLMCESTEAYSTNSTNIYGAIVEKCAVCDGIADAYKYICNKCNIPCITVSGDVDDTVGKNYGHQWNIVEIENTWYLIDSTWDIEYGYDKFFLNEDIKTNGRMSAFEGVPGY